MQNWRKRVEVLSSTLYPTLVSLAFDPGYLGDNTPKKLIGTFLLLLLLFFFFLGGELGSEGYSVFGFVVAAVVSFDFSDPFGFLFSPVIQPCRQGRRTSHDNLPWRLSLMGDH